MSPSRLWPVAAKNLLRHPRRTVVSALAVGFGVAALMFAASFSQAFLNFMVERVVHGKLGALQVHRAGYVALGQAATLDLRLPDDAAFRRRLLGVPGVRAVSARIVFSGLVSSGRSQTAFLARSFREEEEREVCPQLFTDVVEGRLEHGLSGLAGAGLLKGLRTRRGETLMLTATSPRGRINTMSMTVTGATGDVVALENRNVLTVPLELAQLLTGLEGEVTEYAVAPASGADLETVAAALRAELGREYEVHAWGQLVPYLSDGLFYLRWMMVFIGLLLSLMVVAGVTNAMMMGVYERGREIGMQLAVGMRKRDVRVLFLAEAAVLGFCAAVLGLVLGAALVGAMGFVGVPASFMGGMGGGLLRPAVDPAVSLCAAAGAVVTSMVAGLLPAVRASRLKPVDALAGR